MSLSEADIQRVIREELSKQGKPPGWVPAPPNSGWREHPSHGGSYYNGLEHMYYDPLYPTTSGRGMWVKDTPDGLKTASGGPDQGFWGDDNHP